MSQGKNAVIGVRLFHILLGAVLAYAGYQHSQGMKLPKSFYTTIMVLGLGAILYHSYRLLQLLGYVN